MTLRGNSTTNANCCLFVDNIRHPFAYNLLHGKPERPAPGVPVLSGPPRLAVPVPGGRPEDAAAQASELLFAGQDH